MDTQTFNHLLSIFYGIFCGNLIADEMNQNIDYIPFFIQNNKEIIFSQYTIRSLRGKKCFPRDHLNYIMHRPCFIFINILHEIKTKIVNGIVKRG